MIFPLPPPLRVIICGGGFFLFYRRFMERLQLALSRCFIGLAMQQVKSRLPILPCSQAGLCPYSFRLQSWSFVVPYRAFVLGMAGVILPDGQQCASAADKALCGLITSHAPILVLSCAVFGWGVLVSETGRFIVRNGPFCKPERAVLQSRLARCT